MCNFVQNVHCACLHVHVHVHVCQMHVHVVTRQNIHFHSLNKCTAAYTCRSTVAFNKLLWLIQAQ